MSTSGEILEPVAGDAALAPFALALDIPASLREQVLQYNSRWHEAARPMRAELLNHQWPAGLIRRITLPIDQPGEGWLALAAERDRISQQLAEQSPPLGFLRVAKAASLARADRAVRRYNRLLWQSLALSQGLTREPGWQHAVLRWTYADSRAYAVLSRLRGRALELLSEATR